MICVCLPGLAARKSHLCSAHVAQGTVALTFDDGPSIYTKKIMQILEKYHVKATFFVVGKKAKANPKFLKQMFADGNAIGNHSLTHAKITQLSRKQLYNEIVVPENIIYKITGKRPKLFRFPYGAENKKVRDFVESQGLRPIYWNYSPEDYSLPGSRVIARRVISHAHSGQVILLHDGPSRRQQTVDALPKIIEGIKKKGLDFSVICG